MSDINEIIVVGARLHRPPVDMHRGNPARPPRFPGTLPSEPVGPRHPAVHHPDERGIHQRNGSQDAVARLLFEAAWQRDAGKFQREFSAGIDAVQRRRSRFDHRESSVSKNYDIQF